MKDSQSCQRSILQLPQPLLMESASPGLDQPLQEPCSPKPSWAPSSSCCPRCAWVWPNEAKGWCWILPRENTAQHNPWSKTRISPGTQTPRCLWWAQAQPKPPNPPESRQIQEDAVSIVWRGFWGELRAGLSGDSSPWRGVWVNTA